MKKSIIVFLFLLFLIPTTVFAISDNYSDVVANITKTEIDNSKINLYLFHGAECPHCEEEREWLKSIEKDYKNSVNIYYFEVWHDDTNKDYMSDIKEKLKISQNGIPLTIIGDKYFIGFSDTIGSQIENQLKEYLEIENNSNEVKIPILGNVNMKTVSIPLVAVILGFIDGFNPCAMWILLFLLNLLFRVEKKKKAWTLGIMFLFVSGLVYLLSMIGINLILGVATIKWMKIAIAIFILVAGLLNLKKYIQIRNEEASCTVVDNKRRKKLISRMKQIIESKSFILSIIGIIVLAVSVNLIEIACSLGFPVVFNELLTINNITGITKIIYLLIYIFFYMIDDMIVFTISMVTLQATGITNKYNKLCTLVSAIIMIIMGLLLLFKPDWLMLNF